MATLKATVAASVALLVMGLAPLAATVVFSLRAPDAGGLSFSLWGYGEALAPGRLAELAHIASRAAAATVVAVGLAVPAAFRLRQVERPAVQLLLLSLIIAPWLVSDMLRAFGWQLALSPGGPVSRVSGLFLGSPPLEGLRYNHVAAVVGLVSATLPAAIVSTYAALPRNDSSEWRAARELGSSVDLFRLMALGRARLGVSFGACMTLLLCLFASAEPQFLDGPTRSSMLTIASSLANVGVPALMAFGVLMLALAAGAILPVVVVYGRWRRSGTDPRRTDGPLEAFRTTRPSSKGGAARAAANLAAAVLPGACLVAALLLTLLPVGTLSIEAFWQPDSAGGRWTFDNFGNLAASADLLAAAGRSAALAAAVAGLATALGFSLSLTSWQPARARGLLLAMAVLALLPAEVFSLGLLQVARVAGSDEGGPLLTGLAHIVWIVPFSTGSLMLANAWIGRSVVEAALELGRPPASVAIGPLRGINGGAIAAAALFSFTLSLNENTRATYLGGSSPSLANQVFGRLQAGLLPENREIFALESLLVAAALVSSLVMLLALARGTWRRDPGRVR